MDEQERAQLATLIKGLRERRYGTKSAAYAAAEVNAATWDKAEAGESLREDRLRKIVRTLWPESEGDWTEILDGPLTDTKADVLADLKAQVDELRATVAQQGEEIRRLNSRRHGEGA